MVGIGLGIGLLLIVFVNSTKNEPTRSATAPVAQAPVTAAPSYPPPTVAPVTQNRQAALETVIQQRAAAESVNVLGQQVLFSNPRDRKSVVSGKSVSVRVVPGGALLIQKK